MKKYLLALLFVSGCSFAASGDKQAQPKEGSNYVTPERFVYTPMSGMLEYIVTDTKTGCQYLVVNSGGSARPSTSLGCFLEYKR